MAVKSGFFNSVEGDRVYNADDLSTVYEGIIKDGVVKGVGNDLAVKPSSGTTIFVDTGKAIVGDKWLRNTEHFDIELEPADATYTRIDRIVVHLAATGRIVNIQLVTGTPSANPTPYYPRWSDAYFDLAHITVPANVTTITKSMITDARVYSGVIGVDPKATLWTNPNQSTNQFAEQSITLSNSMDDFELIAIEAQNGQMCIGTSGQFVQIEPDPIGTSIGFTMKVRRYEGSGTEILFTDAHTLQYNYDATGGTIPFIVNETNGVFIPNKVYGINHI